MNSAKNDPIVRDGKHSPTYSIPIFLLAMLIGVPTYVVIVLPLSILSFIFVKLTGLKPKAPSKPLPAVLLEMPYEIKQWDERKYDLVLFGATGFTGKLAAQYLAKNYGKRVKWAIAGRSMESLKALRTSLEQIDKNLKDLDLLICDASIPISLKNVVAETRVVATTVGPFTLYGTPLVSLCAQLGTSYCDITGEITWVRKIINDYHSEAIKSGARIINLSGHDCIPWDLTVLQISNELQKKGETLSEIKFFDQGKFAPSGGTLETMMLIINNPPTSKFPFDPLVSSIDGTKSDNRFESKNVRYLTYSNEIKKWVGPFVMADANASCVRRSNAVLNYSKNLSYSEALQYGDFVTGCTAFFISVFSLTCLVTVPFQILLKNFVLPKPGSGPSKEDMDKGFLMVKCIGKGNRGSVVKTSFYFPTDAGYRDTARMLVETGLSLALDKHNIGGGVWTPACIGEPLLERLKNTGCEWKIEI